MRLRSAITSSPVGIWAFGFGGAGAGAGAGDASSSRASLFAMTQSIV